MVKFIARTEGVTVSRHYVAKLWGETGLKPHRQGTFKLCRDPAFADKAADAVEFYLDPPGGAVVLTAWTRTPGPGPRQDPAGCCRSASR